MRVPLRHRLPNATPWFVGRERDRAWLREALERAPVAVIAGLGGVGKTALVLHTLHHDLPERVARTVLISLTPSGPAHQVAFDVARALATSVGSDVAWDTIAGDRDAALELGLDLAEQHGLWVVLDDIHHAKAELDALLCTLAGYARDSRWICTSRVVPAAAELAGHVRVLAGLERPELVELARACAPELSAAEIDRIVGTAAGSPWMVRQAAAGGGDRGEAARRLEFGLEAHVIAAVELLACLELPIPVEVLAEGRPLAPDEVELLERTGIVQRTAAGLRLHDVARGIAAAAHGKVALDRVAALASRLADHDAPNTALEATRLMLELGRGADASRILERSGRTLLRGDAPRLYELLERFPDPRWHRWRLRCAVEIDDADVLSRVQLPNEPTSDDRRLWARACYMSGRPTEAAEAALAALTEATGAAQVGAMVVALEALAVAGNVQRLAPLVQLLAVAPVPEDSTARRDALLARGHAAIGAYREARAAVARARSGLGALSAGRRWEVRQLLVIVLIDLGRIDEAAAVLAELRGELTSEAADLSRGRYSRVWGAPIATARGALREAARIVDALLPRIGRRSMQRAILLGADLHRRLAAGELAGLEGRIAAFVAEAEAAGNRYFVDMGHVLALQLAVLTARAVAVADDHPASGAHRDLVALYRELLDRRAGVALPAAAPPTRVPDGIEARALAHRVAAEDALLRGDLIAARSAATAAVAVALELGYELHAIEVRLLLADLAILARAPAELALQLAALERAASESARIAGDVRFLRRTLGQLDGAELERAAADLEVAPVSARRARALLGASAAVDAIDRAVIDAIRESSAWTAETLGAPDAWRRGWGLDTRDGAVWIGERRVELGAGSLVFRLLDALFTAGGTIDKEHLVPALWDGEAYDPIRHNNRLHTTINKLRRWIEDDPSQPTRLVTTSDGYAFGAEPVRRIRAVIAR